MSQPVARRTQATRTAEPSKLRPTTSARLIGLGSVLLGAGRPDGASLAVRSRRRRRPRVSRMPTSIGRSPAISWPVRLRPKPEPDVLRFLELAPNDPRRTLAEQLLAAPPPSAAP